MEMAMDTDNVNEDSEQIYSQICDEIGVDYVNDAGAVYNNDLGAGGVAAGTGQVRNNT